MITKNYCSISSFPFPEALRKLIVVFGITSLVLGMISKINIIDLDLFHQIALFREYITKGNFPYVDVFSYVETKSPVIHHEWGHGALMYFLIFPLGLDYGGLLIFRYLLYALIIFGCYLFCNLNGVNFYTFSSILLITIPVGLELPIIRAQIFTQLFLVLSFLCVFYFENSNRYLIFILVPTFIVWANFHAGFLVGFGYIGFYFVEKFFRVYAGSKSLKKTISNLRHLMLLLVFLSISVLITPYGFDYFPYLYDAVRLDRTDLISEWKPLWKGGIGNILSYLLCLSLIVYSLIVKGIKNLPSFIFICALSWLTFQHYKYTTLFSIVMICYLPVIINKTTFQKILSNLPDSFPRVYFVLWIVVGIIGLISAFSNEFWLARLPSTLSTSEKSGGILYPIGPVRYLSQNKFTGNMVTHFNFGAYVSWKLYPKVKVGMDSRFEVVYSLASFHENINFYAGKAGWEDYLLKYSPEAILVPLWCDLANVIGDKIEINNGKKKLVYQNKYLDDGFRLYILEDFKYPFVDKKGETFYESFHS